MGCNDKVRSTCGRILSSNCVDYVGTLHNNSSLEECDDPTMTEIIQDINVELDAVNQAIELQNLGDGWVTYELVDGKVRVKEALEAIESKLCALSALVEDVDSNGCPLVYSLPIDCVGLDLGSLVDPCGEQPGNLAELLQLLINNTQNT